MKNKERPFAFLTTDSFRIEVKALHPIQAYYRARKKAARLGRKITRTYTTYGRHGIDTGWRGLPARGHREQRTTVRRKVHDATTNTFGGDTGVDADFDKLVTFDEMNEGSTQRDVDMYYDEEDED